ncbi:unnamed protein product, partial [marine sediment metagenome]
SFIRDSEKSRLDIFCYDEKKVPDLDEILRKKFKFCIFRTDRDSILAFRTGEYSEVKDILQKLKALEETRSFYNWKLKDKGLTEKQRNEFLKALKIIEKIIKKKEQLGKKLKHKKFIPYDHKKAVFRNSERGY